MRTGSNIMTFYFRVRDSKMCLYIEDWHVASYPMSYTVKECLEEFCEMVGWDFESCQGSNRIGPTYQFKFRSPKFTLVWDAVYSNADRVLREMRI